MFIVIPYQYSNEFRGFFPPLTVEFLKVIELFLIDYSNYLGGRNDFQLLDMLILKGFLDQGRNRNTRKGFETKTRLKTFFSL